jgi:hypothetical protein
LKIDLDFFAPASWLEQYRQKAKLVLRSYGLGCTAVRITPSRSKGYHARIYLTKPVPAETANKLQWLLLDDSARVGLNMARIAVGYPEWSKLFDPKE